MANANTNAMNKVTLSGRPKRRPIGDVILIMALMVIADNEDYFNLSSRSLG